MTEEGFIKLCVDNCRNVMFQMQLWNFITSPKEVMWFV